MSDHHLVPVLTPPSASKKNASDFSLTIDAVALLHRGIFDHAVIASGDGDFTQLAIHIREHGKGVDGIGRELNSGADLRQAFDNYVILSNPITKTEKPVPVTKSEPAAATKSVPAQKPLSPSSIDPKQLLGFFTELTVGGKSLSVQSFGTVLTNRLGQNYKRGHGRLINYLKKSGVFDVDKGIVILTRQSR